jgi:hypothetical protein
MHAHADALVLFWVYLNGYTSQAKSCFLAIFCRGAASLDWSKRPGNYAAAESVLKGFVRTAVPIPSMVKMCKCRNKAPTNGDAFLILYQKYVL